MFGKTEKFNEKFRRQNKSICELKEELDQLKASEAERDQLCLPPVPQVYGVEKSKRVEENRTTNKGQGIGSLTNEGLTQLLKIIQIGPDQSPLTEWPRKSTGTDQRRPASNAVPSNQKFNEERGQADYSSQAGRKWLEDVLLERIQKRLADFNEDTLNFNLPYEQPECMGKGWKAEAMSFDAKSLKVPQCLSNVRTSINRTVLNTLDVNINETSEYINVLEALSLQIEQLGVEVGFQIIGIQDY